MVLDCGGLNPDRTPSLRSEKSYNRYKLNLSIRFDFQI